MKYWSVIASLVQPSARVRLQCQGCSDASAGLQVLNIWWVGEELFVWKEPGAGEVTGRQGRG